MTLTKQQRNALAFVENAASEWLCMVEDNRKTYCEIQGKDYDPREANWLREQINIVGNITRGGDKCL